LAIIGPRPVVLIVYVEIKYYKFTNISYIEALFKVRFIQDFGLYSVRFRQVSLYMDVFMYVGLM